MRSLAEERADIGKILERLGIDAKKRGREWEAFCPNPEHQDRHPSWRIRDEPGSKRHGLSHCFACGYSGSLVGLVQKRLGIRTAAEARAWLEGEVPDEQKKVDVVEVRVARPRLGFRLPEGVVVEPLESWPTPARRYLESRGIEGWQVDRWGIGYAVEGVLRGRVVFVLRDSKGRPRGYSARSFDGEGKRFREPDEHERASSGAMFGEQHWPASGRSAVFVFEGAIKALAAEAALPGAYVAATTGSEIRPLHADKISTFDRVCVVGDDDLAGNRVSEAMCASLARHCAAERLVLPRGLDADELPRAELAEILMRWLRRG